MTTIEVIELRTILDSRGNATVEADVYTANGYGKVCSAQRCQHRGL